MAETSLRDLGQPSFKKGAPAFKKRRQVAEAIAEDNPDMPTSKKFAIATSATKKVFRKKKK